MRRKIPPSERGQSLVIVALVITALLLFMGLLIDGGLDYAARRQGQNAADAAAFAGVRVLAKKDATTTYANIASAVNTLAQVNLDPFTNAWGGSTRAWTAYFVLDGDPALASHTHCELLTTETQRGTRFSGTLPANAKGVRIYVDITFQPFLMSVMNGGGPVTAGTCATAIFGPPLNPGKSLPIAVPRCYADPNDPYNAPCINPSTHLTPTLETHVILGQGSQYMFDSNQIRAIVNFNDRTWGTPQWDATDEVAVAASGVDASLCGWGNGRKTGNNTANGQYYIGTGGYDGQCGPLVPDVLTNPNHGDWADLLFGNSGGNVGPGEVQNFYPIGSDVLVVLYQECQDANGTIPPMCGVRDGNGAFKDTNNCSGQCRVKLIGWAFMRVTDYQGNSKMYAIFSRNPTPGEICQTGCGGIDTVATIQLVP